MEGSTAENNCELVPDELSETTDNNVEKCKNICLFCSKHSNVPPNLKNNQLTRICQNLKIDLEEIVEIEDNYVLSLCEQCTSVTTKLSTFFEELDTTKMWIAHFLRQLMTILISGEEATNQGDRTEEELEEALVLRELIIEKCDSTIKTMNVPQLKLNRFELPDQPIKQEIEEEDTENEQVNYSSDLPPNSPILIDKVIKLEEIPPPIQNVEEPTSSLNIQNHNFEKPAPKRKPFWFIKPSENLTSSGKRQTKYNCPFCPKILNGYSACKFHIIGKHPEHIFPHQQLSQLTSKEFSSSCSLILEEGVTPISNEDGEGSYTTFECNFCPVGLKERKSDKRVVQVHMIRCHFPELQNNLKIIQQLHGSPEFEEKVSKYSEKQIYSKIGKGGEFKRKWKCAECQCGFPNKKRLKIHLNLHSAGAINLNERVTNEATSTIPKKSPCQSCGKIFSCGYSLWRHKRLSCSKKGEGSENTQVNLEEPEVEFFEDEEDEQDYINYIDLKPEETEEISQVNLIEEEERQIQIKTVKLEEIDVPQILEIDEAAISNIETQVISKKHNPFWFIKSTKEVTPSGQKLKKPRYYCVYCPKSFNGSNCIKFHSINHHPQYIFANYKHLNLDDLQFKACCSTILEEEVTPISNEDGVGSFTTFQCKYCPSTGKFKGHCDKRVIQKHLLLDHFNVLVRKLGEMQLLIGTEEFEKKVGNYLKPSNKRKVWVNQFKRKWKCEGCDRGFPNVNRLEGHRETCEVVGGGGGGKGRGLKEKHESGNTQPKPSPCDKCGKVLSSGFSLWRHKRLRCERMRRRKARNGGGDGGNGGGEEMEVEILGDGVEGEEEDPLDC